MTGSLTATRLLLKLEEGDMTTFLADGTSNLVILPDRNDGLTCTSQLRQLGELTFHWWSQQSGDEDQQSADKMEYSSRVARFRKPKISLYT
jgi:hypothetical protein